MLEPHTVCRCLLVFGEKEQVSRQLRHPLQGEELQEGLRGDGHADRDQRGGWHNVVAVLALSRLPHNVEAGMSKRLSGREQIPISAVENPTFFFKIVLAPKPDS